MIPQLLRRKMSYYASVCDFSENTWLYSSYDDDQTSRTYKRMHEGRQLDDGATN